MQCTDGEISAAARELGAAAWPLDEVQVLPEAGLWVIARRSRSVGGVPLTKPWIFVVLQRMRCSPGYSATSVAGRVASTRSNGSSPEAALTKCEKCLHPYTSNGGASPCDLCIAGYFRDDESHCHRWYVLSRPPPQLSPSLPCCGAQKSLQLLPLLHLSPLSR